MAQPIGAGAGPAPPTTPNREYKIVWGPKDGFYTLDIEDPARLGGNANFRNFLYTDRYSPSLAERVNRELTQGWTPLGNPVAYNYTEQGRVDLLPNASIEDVIRGHETPQERVNAGRQQGARLGPAQLAGPRTGPILGQALMLDRLGQSVAVERVLEAKKVPKEVETIVRSFADMPPRQGGRRTYRKRLGRTRGKKI